MRITAIKYGEALFCEKDMVRGGSKDVFLPISFIVYLIQTQGRNILVDAGMDDKGGFSMPIFKPPHQILAEMGVSPTDITDVIITHAHPDHINGVHNYKNATIYIQKDEWMSEDNNIPEGFKVIMFDNEYILSDRVIVKKIGGHSTGSSIVLADSYVFCGDECYMQKSLTDNIMPGVTCCEKNSRNFLDIYCDEKYIKLLAHDPDLMKSRVGSALIFSENEL